MKFYFSMWLIIVLVFLLETVTCPRPSSYKCPEIISVGWMEIPPYIYRNGSGDSITGPLVNILEKGFKKCCQNNLTFDYDERHVEYSDLVEHTLNSSYDVVLPIIANVRNDKFLAFPYVVLVESPGAVLYNFNRKSAREAIIHTGLASLPLVILLLLYVSIFGIIFWIVDTIPKQNGEERGWRVMLSEIGEGVWWSFVTLATVGYGDVIPTKFLSRIVCYLWMLISSVCIAIFTATVTSTLITQCFSMELKIAGENIGVINGTREHRLILKKNGRPTVFNEYQDLLDNMEKDSNMKGAVVELYAASYFQNEFTSYRIQRVYENVAGYGVVLRTNTVKLQHCMKQYILSSQDEIYNKLRKDLPALSSNITTTAIEEESLGLMSPGATDLRKVLITLSSIMIVLCVLGILRERVQFRKKNKAQSLENFALLHTLKTSFQQSMNKCIHEIVDDINNLQKFIEALSERVNMRALQRETLFRAKIYKPS